MQIKKLKKADLSLTIFIVVGIMIMVNFFSYNLFFRWDLTENKDYSISQVSRNAVSDLDDILKIKVYFTKDLPSQYLSLKQDISDILDEYRVYSDSKVKVEFIDPESLADAERELYLMGIPAIQFNVFEKDKRQVMKGYLGVVVEYKDKKEAIPVVESSYNFEYKMTLAVKKVTNEILATVGVLTSHDCLHLDQEMRAASMSLSEVYNLKTVDLEKDSSIPEEVDTLLIPGPKKAFTENDLKAINNFVMRGGALVLLADGVKLDDKMVATKNELGLDKLYQAYGFKVDNNLVMDVHHGSATFSAGLYTFSTPYALWPKIIKDNFEVNNPTVSKLEEVVLPWSSSVTIDGKLIGVNGGVISYLALTSAKAAAQIDNFVVDPQQSMKDNVAGQFAMAVSYDGKINSAFPEEESLSADYGKWVVVGDSDFASDRFVSEASDNLIFFQNLVDSVSLDNDLIEIRSKSVTSRPIEEMDDAKRAFMRYANVFGATVIVVGYGLIRYSIRRRRGLADEL